MTTSTVIVIVFCLAFPLLAALYTLFKLDSKNSALITRIAELENAYLAQVSKVTRLEESSTSFETLAHKQEKELEDVRTKYGEETKQLWADRGQKEAQVYQLSNIITEQTEKLQALQVASESAKKEYDTLLGQKKSSEVRIGHISESMAPFLTDFKYNPEECRFLGMPIDYVVFDETNREIVFLEIKSGNSQLTPKQKRIKEMVETGKVRFDLYRIKGNTGTTDKER